MGDDDIICLSSDDEETTRELPPKKSITDAQSFIKTEDTLSVNKGQSLKRKDSQNLSEISLVSAKKSKIQDNGSVADISSASSQKKTHDESIFAPEIDTLQSADDKIDKRESLNNSDATLRDKISPDDSSSTKNISPSAKSLTGDLESSSKPQVLKIRHDLKIHSNSGDVRSSSYCQKAYKNKHSVKEVRNIFAKSKETNRAKSSVPTAAGQVETISQFFEIPEIIQNQKKSNSHKIADDTNILLPSKNGRTNAERSKLEAKSTVMVEIPKVVDSNVVADNRTTELKSIQRSSASAQILTGITDKPSTPKVNNNSSSSPRSVHSPHDLPVASLKNKTDKTPRTPTKISLKSNNIRKSATCSKLDEVEIVDTIEKPKSTNASPTDVLKKSSIDVSKASASATKVTPTVSSKQQGENSSQRRNSNSDIYKTSDVKKLPKIDNPTADCTKKDEKRDDDVTDRLKSSRPVIRRIIPQKIVGIEKTDKQKSNDSTSNVSDESSDAGKCVKSKNFEPTPGCSKTPDSRFAKETKSTKRKLSVEAPSIEEPSTNPTDVQEAEKLGTSSGEDTPEFAKPRLVVKTKEPVDSEESDTFAMFLGLCLQTDRTSAMEKIVAKLKHHYDLMCPKYAKSKAFRNLLNEKRDKIINTGKVYYFIGQVAEEMKRRKNRPATSKKNFEDANDEAKTSFKENEEENDAESRRLEAKIRTIDKAMKQCQKRIRELEEAEVDFDDENNSHYIKLDRYKDKVIELYTKMCEYTKEHADAGRAYLRPKHLRVTQIPAIDLAINSFLNSKFSYNRKKGTKGRSFVDGLIFPDYVDILECVGKVNTEQDLGLSKRRQQKLAEEAFTQLGKHLQTARQQDYWDTFSMILEEGEDPATSDAQLSKKLAENQVIAEKRTKEIFEEFVKKQEEGKVPSSNSEVSSEGDDDDDDDDDDNNEDNDNNENEGDERKSSHSNESGVEPFDSGDEKTERQTKKDNENDDTANTVEILPEASRPKDSPTEKVDAKVPDVRTNNDETTANDVPATSKKKLDEPVKTSESEATENSIQDKAIAIEANLAEDDTKDAIEPVVEPAQQYQQPLRIRSFAKPPSSWISSQEVSKSVTNENIPKNTVTIDLSDDESTSPSKTAVTSSKALQQIRAQTNNMKSTMAADPSAFQLAKDKSITGPSALGNRPVQRTSSIAAQMKMRIPHAGQVGRLSITQQLRPQMAPTGTLRVIPSGRAQILRFSNGQSIRATSATFRPVDVAQPHQKTPVASLPNLPNSRSPTITLNNPRFIRLPSTTAARSPDISQLRIERIEDSSKNSSGVSTHENSIRTLPEMLITRASPVLKPRLNENVPTTQQSPGAKRSEKIISIAPNSEPTCKK